MVIWGIVCKNKYTSKSIYLYYNDINGMICGDKSNPAGVRHIIRSTDGDGVRSDGKGSCQRGIEGEWERREIRTGGRQPARHVGRRM